MDKRDLLSYGLNKINTTVAYEVWGIDANDLERRRKKLRDLGLTDSIRCDTLSVHGKAAVVGISCISGCDGIGRHAGFRFLC